MKVLWFTNTPCSAVDKIGMNINTGGWLRSLEEELNNVPGIELAICFYSYQAIDPFIHNGTHYYPIRRKGKKNKFSRLIKRIYINGNNDEQEIHELLKIIDLFKPNIIHVHGTEDNFGLVQYHTNISVVISIQGILNPIAEKYFSGIPAHIISRYEGLITKFLASGFKQNYNLLKKNAEREIKILKETKFIIGRTNWDRRITRILAPNSLYFEGNEILRPTFYLNKWNKLQFGSPLKIVSNMGHGLYKGFETIVNVALILSKNSNINFVWKVIGLNENSINVKIVKKWKKINLTDLNIELLGLMNDEEIVDTLLKSDIYCQTSHIENSPNSLCEAMIIGMPIIATNAGGSSSLIKDNEEGIIVQDGDPWSMAGAIIELINDKEKIIRLSESARKSALIRHNKNKIISDLIKTYECIMSN